MPSRVLTISLGKLGWFVSQHAAADIAECPDFQCSFGFPNRRCQSVPEVVGTKIRFMTMRLRSNARITGVLQQALLERKCEAVSKEPAVYPFVRYRNFRHLGGSLLLVPLLMRVFRRSRAPFVYLLRADTRRLPGLPLRRLTVKLGRQCLQTRDLARRLILLPAILYRGMNQKSRKAHNPLLEALGLSIPPMNLQGESPLRLANNLFLSPGALARLDAPRSPCLRNSGLEIPSE